MGRLSGKVAIVTGAAMGNGKGGAEAYAKQQAEYAKKQAEYAKQQAAAADAQAKNLAKIAE